MLWCHHKRTMFKSEWVFPGGSAFSSQVSGAVYNKHTWRFSSEFLIGGVRTVFDLWFFCQGRCIRALTGMGYTEAPHQPEQLCTLWRRRSCQSRCNIPPIPERTTWQQRLDESEIKERTQSPHQSVFLRFSCPGLTSEVCFCHSNLLMGAESRADSIAK